MGLARLRLRLERGVQRRQKRKTTSTKRGDAVRVVDGELLESSVLMWVIALVSEVA